jgi:hypothetical protein
MPEAIGKIACLPSLPSILSSDEEGVQTMDVVLDTCWAVLTEIEQNAGSAGMSAHLREFKQQCTRDGMEGSRLTIV